MKNGTFDTFAIDGYFAKLANQVSSNSLDGNRSLKSMRKQPLFARHLKEASTFIVLACQLIVMPKGLRTHSSLSSHMVTKFHILICMEATSDAYFSTYG